MRRVVDTNNPIVANGRNTNATDVPGMSSFISLVVDRKVDALTVGHTERELKDTIAKTERYAGRRNMIPFRFLLSNCE